MRREAAGPVLPNTNDDVSFTSEFLKASMELISNSSPSNFLHRLTPEDQQAVPEADTNAAITRGDLDMENLFARIAEFGKEAVRIGSIQEKSRIPPARYWEKSKIPLEQPRHIIDRDLTKLDPFRVRLLLTEYDNTIRQRDRERAKVRALKEAARERKLRRLRSEWKAKEEARKEALPFVQNAEMRDGNEVTTSDEEEDSPPYLPPLAEDKPAHDPEARYRYVREQLPALGVEIYTAIGQPTLEAIYALEVRNGIRRERVIAKGQVWDPQPLSWL
ncbi:hypothetical protein CC80DRAFT_541812 [Byssothecium circinans]|uniref:Uncharacterized protein n=1 Tax=Byssothecium circinans TaxID=147558 RepID=A0A6A5UD29_9PLEO|nr:hypothetical protein CC80DRAFT_541812 [Byssothecium circinans]